MSEALGRELLPTMAAHQLTRGILCRLVGLRLGARVVVSACTGTEAVQPSTTDPGLSTTTSSELASVPCTTAGTTPEAPTTTAGGYTSEAGYPVCVEWHPDPATGTTVRDSAYPEWRGGDELRLGEPWQSWVLIGGCGFQFVFF